MSDPVGMRGHQEETEAMQPEDRGAPLASTVLQPRGLGERKHGLCVGVRGQCGLASHGLASCMWG